MEQGHANHSMDIWQEMIERIHRNAQTRYEIQDELYRLRKRSELESEKTRWEYFRQITEAANIDMAPIYSDAQRRHNIQKARMSKNMDRLKEKAEALGREETIYRNRVRKTYLQDFREYYKKKEGNPEIKFAVIDPTTVFNYLRGVHNSSGEGHSHG